MKKILSVALVIVMMMAMSVTAFAAEAGTVTIDSASDTDNTLPYDQDINVNVRLDSDGDGIPDNDDPQDDADRVLVELSWTDMEFMYSKIWDGYAGETTGEWVETDQFITVTNRSSVGVTAAFNYTQISTDYSIEFSVRERPTEEGTNEVRKSNAEFSDNVLTLADPTTATLDQDEDGNNILPWAEIAVNLADGAKVPEVDSGEAVGTITVTIEAPDFVPSTPAISTYSILGDDREGLYESNVTISIDQEIEFHVDCYQHTFDEIPNNERYTVTSVTCESTPDVVEISGDYTIKFNQPGTYNVVIAFDCPADGFQYSDVNLTVTVE